MKKVIAVVLSVLAVLGVFAPAAAAYDAGNYPVVYVTGYGPNIFAEKGNMESEIYYPTSEDIGAIVEEALGPCLKELAAGVVTKNFDKYCDELYSAIAPIYEDLVLAPDGTPKDNSGRGENPEHIFLDYSRFSAGEETFPYDWRLSPEYSAEELDAFIDTMLRNTGAKKVNIVGRCLGGNVVSAYLENFSEEAKAKVNEIVMFIPSTEGINMIGALFAGDINIDVEKLDVFLDEYMKYKELIEDPVIKEFLTVMVTVLEQVKLLNLPVLTVQAFVDAIKDNLVPRLIRRSYGSFPSFWAMVPDEYLEDALAFVYNTPELKQEYAGTIAKARSYHDNVMVNARETTKEMSQYIDISVISKYNIPVMPIFTDCANTSDGTAETYLTSFGATTADFGEVLSEKYIAGMSEEDKKYLSPDEKIDASTALLPEKTWFIKNSYHDHFPASIDALIETIFTTVDMTVFTNEAYPQYLDANVDGAELTPVEGKDNVAKESFLSLFIRFFKSFFAVFLKLFNIG